MPNVSTIVRVVLVGLLLGVIALFFLQNKQDEYQKTTKTSSATFRPSSGHLSPSAIATARSDDASERKIICNGYNTLHGQPYELSLDKWLSQPTDNSWKLCDPLFTPSNTKVNIQKPVQVFILLGQSNMLGMAKIDGDEDGSLEYAVVNKKRFQHLLVPSSSSPSSQKTLIKKNLVHDMWMRKIQNYVFGRKNDLNWTIRHDVRNVAIMGESPSRITKNEWLTVSGKTFGPDLQFGYILAELLDRPVLLLKSCIGNRALGWDLLPPSVTKPFDYNGYRYPPYGGYPEKWPVKDNNTKGLLSDPSLLSTNHSWYAGKEYDIDVTNAKSILSNLTEYYPLATNGYEIAGFVWWQGDRDRRDSGHAEAYESNMVQFIHSIRKTFAARQAPFVLATIGMDGYNMTGDTLKVFEAQMAVSSESGKYPRFQGNVLSMDIRSSYRGGGYHYGKNADTYMEVGNALGLAMAKLMFPKKVGGQRKKTKK